MTSVPRIVREPAGGIAEFQGLYGAFHISEILLQKIWLRGEFASQQARTTDGDTVSVTHPGRWNRLSGPDFADARLVIGGLRLNGDVEVHFHAGAWHQHRHDTDPAYDNVALHVVLFPPQPGESPAVTRSGRLIPTLVLVDLLWHDLEEYAAEEAISALNGRDPWPVLETLLSRVPAERASILNEAARQRWEEKVRFAGVRIDRLGWEEACHLSTLEILGYRANRGAMMRVASAFPWSGWGENPPTCADLLEAAVEWWTLRGVRPANQPRIRLEQYRDWVGRAPDWPDRLRSIVPPKPPEGIVLRSCKDARKRLGLLAWRASVAGSVCGSALGGTRLDTWFTNLALPFLAVGGTAPWAEALWHAWWPGDFPDILMKGGRQLCASAGEPLSNGSLQALLALQLRPTDPKF